MNKNIQNEQQQIIKPNIQIGKQNSVTKYKIIIYVFQIITILLTLAYIIISQSLFTTINLLFLLLIIFTKIFSKKIIKNVQKQKNISEEKNHNQINQKNNQINYINYNQNLLIQTQIRIYEQTIMQKIIWILFPIFNLLILIFKIIILATDKFAIFQNQLQFYELQSLYYMFIPSVILGFSIITIIIKLKFSFRINKKSYKLLKQYKKQIPDLIKTLLYLLLGILIVVMQIWTQSIIGLGYFLIALAIFSIRNNKFNNKIYQFLVSFIQLYNILIIITNYLFNTVYFQSFSWQKYYSMIGLDGISNFISNPLSTGHFITEIILFFYSSILQNLFQYQNIHIIFSEKENNYSISQRQIFGQSFSQKQQIEQSPITMLRENLLTSKQKEQLLQSKPKRQQTQLNSNIFTKFKSGFEYQLQSIQFRQNNGNNHKNVLKIRRQSEPVANFQNQREQSSGRSLINPYYQNILKVHEQNKKKRTFTSSTSKKLNYVKKNNLDQSKKQQKVSFKKVMNKILSGIYEIIKFLNSSEFSLRIIQIFSIVIIQRYNNIYSFVTLLWLAMVASFQNMRVIFIITTLFILPLEIGNYIIMFLFNMPNSFFSRFSGFKIWGFINMEAVWLDVIIFNIYLYFIILFINSELKKRKQQNRSRDYSKNLKVQKPSYFVLFFAFIFRYTYLLTIAAIFFFSFSNVTLINFFYSVIFFFFFTFGQNLTIQSKRKSKKSLQGNKIQTQVKYYRTTLARRFWWIIVIYTLLCILLKYIYFLFFNGQATDILLPTGINQIFNWSFNFSLSSICQSNTTPLFIIFVFAQIQIIIHRSNIYLNYSFSNTILTKQKSNKNEPNQINQCRTVRIKLFFKKFLIFCFQIYYQGLYYYSGIIIIACTYNWNIIQIPIIILICLGLLYKYNKKILIAIVFLDLFYIFLDYLFRFTFYDSVKNTIGQQMTQIIQKIVMFCGFTFVSNDQLYTILALNVVIFYFSVESYRLCHILSEQDQYNQLSPEEQEKKQLNRPFKQQKNKLKHSKSKIKSSSQINSPGKQFNITQYQPTIIGSQFQDQIFATQYEEFVILTTKNYYYTDLTAKYSFLKSFFSFLSITMVNIVSIFVLACSLYFRLSVSMLIFLLIYLIFYFKLFDKIGDKFIQNQYMKQIQSYLKNYNDQQKILQQKNNPSKIQNNHEKNQELKSFLKETDLQATQIKYNWKRKIWFYSSIWSVFCLIVTYSAQFILSQFYQTFINPEFTNIIQNILFILGFSVTNQVSLFRQAYFYYFMVLINVIQKLLIQYSEKIHQQQIINKVQTQKQIQFIKEINQIENPYFLTHEPQITQNFILEQQNFQILKQMQIDQIDSEQQEIIIQNQDQKLKQVTSTCNVLAYCNYKQVQIQTNALYGFSTTTVRIYLWLMFINIYVKNNNISTFLYIFAIFYFWFKKLQFTVVKNINKASILIMVFQYVILLLDIEQNTSPLILPNNQEKLSFLQLYITNQDWLDFIVLSKDSNYSSIIFLSFFTNSIIIFLTQVYFYGIRQISKLCVNLTQKVLLRYNYMYKILYKMQINQVFDLNYQKYKSFFYRTILFLYQNFILNSYILVSIIILLLLSASHTIISLGLLILLFIYIYIALFTKYGKDGKLFVYTKLFFSIYRIILFTIISIAIIIFIPTIQNYIGKIPEQIGIQINLSDIFSLLFLQLWMDLTISNQFYKVTVQGTKNLEKRQNVRLKCLSYQENNSLIQSMIKSYKNILAFEIYLIQAKKIIKQWDNTFKIEDQTINKSKYKFDTNFSLNNDQKSSIIQDNRQSEIEVNIPLQNLMDKVRQQIKKQEQKEEQTSIKESFIEFLQKNTKYSLSFSYIQLMKFIIKNNEKVFKKISNYNNLNINLWDFIKGDYTILQEQIIKLNDSLHQISKKLKEEQYQYRIDYLQILKAQQYDSQEINRNSKQNDFNRHSKINSSTSQISEKELIYKISTPKMINLITKQKIKKDESIFQHLWYWFLSNFNYFIIFMLFIYYCINPSLLSLPLIVYMFAYQIIADKRYDNLVLLYIFIVIVLSELLQLNLLTNYTYTQFLFYYDTQDNTYQFAVGYLFYLFILVFIHEQIKKFQGTKYHETNQVQNLQMASLRNLLNESQDSNLYLWDMYIYDSQEQEQKFNPMLILSQKIQENPQKLLENQSSSFYQIFYRNKKGIDFYPYIATIQVFIMIYLIFFYPLMTLVNQTGLQQSYKYFSFSSHMIIAILIHVGVIILQRKITLLSSENKYKQLIKYIFTMIIFILFLIFIYYWASYKQPDQYQSPQALIVFSFFYFFYFLFSGLQVKYGYQKFKKINSFMVKRQTLNYYFMMIFVSIPFLYEIKCIMDWTFIRTSLQLFDWFKLFSIYVSSFKAKMQYKATIQSDLGHPLDRKGKIIGWLGFLILLLIIFGPMILFSGLNPTAKPNLVVGGSFQIGIQIIGGNYFNLYKTSHFSAAPSTISQSQFYQQGFNNVPVLSTLTAYDLSRQFQNLSFQQYSDDFWGISRPNFYLLKNSINESLYQQINNLTVINRYKFVIDYVFERQIAEVTASSTEFSFPFNENQGINVTILQALNSTFHNCNTSTTISGLYNSLIRLLTSGNSFKPTPIFFTDQNGEQQYLQDVNLTMICATNDSNIINQGDTNNIYWSATIQSKNSGINFYVFCDLYQSLLGGLSFTAIYTSVILVIAGFIRSLLAGNLPLIPYEMNAKPDKILQICEAISILRNKKQYKEEFLMYYQLIDVIRSPQIIRKLGSSYSKLIERQIKKKQLKQKQKIQKQKLKNL